MHGVFFFFSFQYIGCKSANYSKIIELMSINIRITLQSRKRLVELYYYTNIVCIVNTYFETNVIRNTVTSTVYEYLRLRYIFSRCIRCNKDVGQSVLRILLRECLANKKNRGEMWTLARRWGQNAWNQIYEKIISRDNKIYGACKFALQGKFNHK